ncbi:MAG: hypothetical protein IPM54_07615 [Polyangiaceae bacterium]|nr:hypothetical protein [Polyangiaceae bacterium]
MKKLVMIAAAALFVLGGCAKPVRYRTAGHWTMPPEGKPTLYQTYLEGNCSSGFAGFGQGCSDTNSKLKRCTLNDDNTLTCVEDAEANKMLNKDLPEAN